MTNLKYIKQKLEELNTSQISLIDLRHTIKVVDVAMQEHERMLKALKEINSLCADYSNNEEGFINVGQLAKISINAIKQATE